jgi:hypothetical protein
LKFFEKTEEIKNWKIVIHQNSKSKATWFRVVDGKKEPLNNQK